MVVWWCMPLRLDIVKVVPCTRRGGGAPGDTPTPTFSKQASRTSKSVIKLKYNKRNIISNKLEEISGCNEEADLSRP